MKNVFAKSVLSLVAALSALTAVDAASAETSPTYTRNALPYTTSVRSSFGRVRFGNLWVGAHGPYNEYKNIEAKNPSDTWFDPQVAKLGLICSDFLTDPGQYSIVRRGFAIQSKSCNLGTTANWGAVAVDQ